MPDSPPGLPPGSRLGAYEILGPLGAGGMGEVYRAHDPRLKRDVAVKIVRPGLLSTKRAKRRFEQEARAVAALSHPNVLAIHELGEEGGQVYAVMELLEGQTLRTRLMSGALGWRRAVEIGAAIAEGMAAAHAKGVVHRDLKPANVFLTADGQVKVLDFGLAMVPEPAEAGAPPSQTQSVMESGGVLGTVGYMAPEQAAERAVDSRADIFSLGCVLYEMVAGARPFARPTTAETLAAILSEDPAEPEAGPPALRRTIARCLEKDPDARFQSARDLAFGLRGILESASGEGDSRERGSRLPVALLWALAGVAIGWAVWSGAGRGVSEPGPAVEFAIEPPSGTRHLPAWQGGGAVISPDGQRVAFVAGLPGGDSAIYLRELSVPEPRIVGGTDGGRWPFWASDSRRMGFTAKGAIHTVDLDTEVSLRVAETSVDVCGGAWSDRDGGWIVFPQTQGGGLVRVREGGGDVQVVTRPARDGQRHLWPYFLPDGERFLYTVSTRGEDDAELRLAHLERGDIGPLVAAPSMGVYGEADGLGRLLFARDGTLFSQRFDPGTAVLSGSAEPLISELPEDVLSTLRYPFSASLEGRWTYQRAGQSLVNELVWRDRAGRRLGVVGKPGRYAMVSLSPDERQVAATIVSVSEGTTDVWTIDLDRGVAQRQTDDPDLDRVPVWSPDGSTLLVGGKRGPNGRILAVPVGSGSETEFLRYEEGQPSDDWPSDWNGTSGVVLFSRGLLGPEATIWSLEPGGDAKPLFEAPGRQWNARLSPDGRWIAFSSSESGSTEVWLSRFPQLERRIQVSSGGGNYPLWRGDGRELFYVSSSLEIMSVDVSPNAEPPVSRPRRLFSTRLPFVPMETVYRCAVTRDGERFLCLEPVAEPLPVVSLSFRRGGETGTSE